MGRPVVLSNGQLFVGLNENGLVHDFYYPYVGLENLNNARSLPHKLGIWVDGKFSWLDDASWKTEVRLEENALISDVKFHSEKLQITLHATDLVDSENNALLRRFSLTNHAEQARTIRLFAHQVFQISRAGRADTAIYVPEEHYILDYKGRLCIVVGGRCDDGTSFDQYSVGNYGIEGKEGTFIDAEDGELANNAVEHGGVDSVVRFSKHIEPGATNDIDYWLIAAGSQSDAQSIHISYKNHDITENIARTRDNWQKWLMSGRVQDLDKYQDDLKHSLLIIKAHCDERGSVLASGDSSIFNYGRDYYCYCWPRDAALALMPFIRLGYFEEAKKFLEFARDTMHPDGYMMHKYQPDRAIGSTWHPLVHGRSQELAIQEDETAILLVLISDYYAASNDKIFVENLYHTFIKPCANFMCRYIDEATGLPHASYDLWEEKFITSTYTVSVVIAGLEAAAELANTFDNTEDSIKWRHMAEQIRQKLDSLYHPDGYFRKGLLLGEDDQITYDDTLDISSLYGPYKFAGLDKDDPRIVQTATQIEQRILNQSPSGGVVRYENDNYFRTKSQYAGNPWVVSTMWLAQYYIATQRPEQATQLLDWARQRELLSGALSEQFDPETAEPLGVTPLVWSQAELINTILDITKQPAE